MISFSTTKLVGHTINFSVISKWNCYNIHQWQKCRQTYRWQIGLNNLKNAAQNLLINQTNYYSYLNNNSISLNPGIAHWKAIKRILRYLRGTLDYMLCYGGQDLCLVGYTDANWGGDHGQQKSTSGYAFLLHGSAITWLSKKTDLCFSIYDGVRVCYMFISCLGSQVA